MEHTSLAYALDPDAPSDDLTPPAHAPVTTIRRESPTSSFAAAAQGLLRTISTGWPAPRERRSPVDPRGVALTLVVLALLLAGASQASAQELRFAGAAVHLDDTNAQTDAELDLLRAAGANAVRVDANWGQIERLGDDLYNPAQIGTGSLDCDAAPAALDHAVCSAAARGIEPLLVLYWTPTWARSPLCRHHSCAPAEAREYGEVAAHLAERYSGRLAGIEIWNEPNSTTFMQNGELSSDPATVRARNLARLTRAAWKAVHALPEREMRTRIVSGGLATASDVSFLRKLYRVRPTIRGHYDAISIHPYSGRFSPYDLRKDGSGRVDGPSKEGSAGRRHPYPSQKSKPGGSFVGTVRAIHGVMRSEDDRDRELWLTEFGWGTCTGAPDAAAAPSSVRPQVRDRRVGSKCLSQDPQLSAAAAVAEAERAQARYTRQAFTLLRRRLPYVDAAFVYELRNSNTPSPAQERDGNCWLCRLGLVTGDFRAKPGFRAFSRALEATLER